MIRQIAATPILSGVRLTIPAREALIVAGNLVREAASDTAARAYDVELRRPPKGLIAALTNIGRETIRSLRLAIEPEYPGEFRAAWHEQGDVIPCSRCGDALVWYEAGYVPGHRICLRGHGAMLSGDGRSAKATGRTHNPAREYGR